MADDFRKTIALSSMKKLRYDVRFNDNAQIALNDVAYTEVLGWTGDGAYRGVAADFDSKEVHIKLVIDLEIIFQDWLLKDIHDLDALPKYNDHVFGVVSEHEKSFYHSIQPPINFQYSVSFLAKAKTGTRKALRGLMVLEKE